MGKPRSGRTRDVAEARSCSEEAPGTKAASGRDARGRFLPGGAKAAIVAEAVAPKAPATRAGGGRRSKARKLVRWSAQRQARFLATLAETGNVAGSVRAAGLSESTVYRRRSEDDDFRASWEAALGEGMVRLEMTLLDRALNGVRETLWYGGKKVGTALKFNDRLALTLLTAYRNRTAANDAHEVEPEPPIEALREQLKARLSEMNRRMGGAG